MAASNGSTLAGQISTQAVVSYGTNYLGSKVLGEDVSFSWTNLAASVAGAYAGTHAPNVFKHAILNQTVKGFVGSAAGSVLRGDSFRDNAGRC